MGISCAIISQHRFLEVFLRIALRLGLVNADPVHKPPKLSHSRGQPSGGGQP
jgi:hypothetical protein